MAAIVVAVMAEAVTEKDQEETKATIILLIKKYIFYSNKLKPLLLNRQNQLLHIFYLGSYYFHH